MKPEALFEKEIRKTAPLLGMSYEKIPDSKLINASNRNGAGRRESRRPFDGVLIAPFGNLCIECKYQYNQLEDHQKETQFRINAINDTYYVLRKAKLKKGFEYSVIFNGKVLDRSDNVLTMLSYFKKRYGGC